MNRGEPHVAVINKRQLKAYIKSQIEQMERSQPQSDAKAVTEGFSITGFGIQDFLVIGVLALIFYLILKNKTMIKKMFK